MSMSDDTGPRAFSIDEVAKRAKKCRDRVYDAIHSGDLIARKDGRRTIMLADDLDAYLNKLPLFEPKAKTAA